MALAAVTKYPGTAYAGPAYVNNSTNTLPNTGMGQIASSGILKRRRPGGRIKVNAYRALGDYLALIRGEGTSLEEQVGVWGEYVVADRYAYLLDYSPAYGAANPADATKFGFIDTANSKGSTFKPGYQWYMHVYNKTFQPYADVIWKPIPNLTIEAGVKDSNFTIDLEAPVNQGTETAQLQQLHLHELGAPLLRELPDHAGLVGLRAAGKGDRLSDSDRRGKHPQ